MVCPSVRFRVAMAKTDIGKSGVRITKPERKQMRDPGLLAIQSAFAIPDSKFSVRVQCPNRFKHDIADDLQTFWTQLVHGVLRGVVVNVIESVIEIDDIGDWDPDFRKRFVIVFNCRRLLEEIRLRP